MNYKYFCVYLVKIRIDMEPIALYTLIVWENGKVVDIAGTFDNFDAAFEAALEEASSFMKDYPEDQLTVTSANNYEENSIETTPTIVIESECPEKCSDVYYYDIVKHFLNFHEWLYISNITKE